MFTPEQLGRLAAARRFKTAALRIQRARAGRVSRGPAMSRELSAAGSTQNHGTTFNYPSGQSMK